jgi:DMSO/TMAO reductase YedYZ molybdopterin-dependent catalytic subunit
MKAALDQALSEIAFPHSGVIGAITRQQNPVNVEFPFEALSSFVTPTAQFYVRSHFPFPHLEVEKWRLRVEGHVDHPFELTYEEITKMSEEDQFATLECAGNGRVFLVPQVDGAQWELGAVSNARWTGVWLAQLLEKAGVRDGAVEVMFEGADHGMAKEKPTPPDEIHYAHSIPMRKVADTLLAYRMNGEPLAVAHGFPLRVVVGGWYGMASVKWVNRIVVLDQAFRGYFRTVDYAYWIQQAGNPVHVPIEEMSCKAQISRPAKFEMVPRDSDYTVTGAAWTGDADVVRVEVSTDGGETFADAKLLGEPVRHSWRLWTFDWRTPVEPGAVTLLARATDSRGRVQPATRDLSHGTYVIDHSLPCECVVR